MTVPVVRQFPRRADAYSRRFICLSPGALPLTQAASLRRQECRGAAPAGMTETSWRRAAEPVVGSVSKKHTTHASHSPLGRTHL
ncbi:unnamed protein product [Lota lota]